MSTSSMSNMDWSEAEFKEHTQPTSKKTSRSWRFDENDLEKRVPLDNGRHRTNPTSYLGNLDRLPLELLTTFLLQVDLQSLTDFRRVNRRAMEVVDSIPQYDAIVQHAPSSLRAILAVQKGRQITCQDLCDKLCSFRCETCGEFGGFLYLITFRRACFSCFRMSPDCFPLTDGDFRGKFSSKDLGLRNVEQILSLPGYYAGEIRPLHGRKQLYDFKSWMKAQLDIAREDESYTEELLGGLEEAQKEWQAYTARLLDPSIRWWITPFLSSLSKSNPTLRLPERYMATIRFPSFDTGSKKLEWGFQCRGCLHAPMRGPREPSPLNRIHQEEWARLYRLFNLETFKQHYKTCKNIGCREKSCHITPRF